MAGLRPSGLFEGYCRYRSNHPGDACPSPWSVPADLIVFALLGIAQLGSGERPRLRTVLRSLSRWWQWLVDARRTRRGGATDLGRHVDLLPLDAAAKAAPGRKHSSASCPSAAGPPNRRWQGCVPNSDLSPTMSPRTSAVAGPSPNSASKTRPLKTTDASSACIRTWRRQPRTGDPAILHLPPRARPLRCAPLLAS